MATTDDLPPALGVLATMLQGAGRNAQPDGRRVAVAFGGRHPAAWVRLLRAVAILQTGRGLLVRTERRWRDSQRPHDGSGLGHPLSQPRPRRIPCLANRAGVANMMLNAHRQ